MINQKKKKKLEVKIQLNGFNIAFHPQSKVKSFLIVIMSQTWDSDMGKRGFQKVRN